MKSIRSLLRASNRMMQLNNKECTKKFFFFFQKHTKDFYDDKLSIQVTNKTCKSHVDGILLVVISIFPCSREENRNGNNRWQ